VAQPLDVGLNKPLKDRSIENYRNFVEERFVQGDDSAIPLPQVRKLMAEFVRSSWNDISDTMVRKAWRSTSNGCPLFVNEE
jgi:hypothetical protein